MNKSEKVTEAIEVLGDALAEEYGESAKVTLISFMAALGRKDRTVLVLPKEFVKFEGLHMPPNGLLQQAFANALIELSDRTNLLYDSLWDAFKRGFGQSGEGFNMEMMEGREEDEITAEIRPMFESYIEALGISQLLNPDNG